MWKLLQIELFKIFKRPRTYIPFGAIAAMILIIQLGLKFDGQSYTELLLSSISDSFNISYPLILNGYLVAFVILNTLLIQIPLLVALVAGDMVAGEANMGTLRLLVTRPVSRTQLMLVKYGASVIYTILLLIWMALLALFLSMWIFGTNDLIIARDTVIEHIRQTDVMWRYIAAFGYAMVALSTVAAVLARAAGKQDDFVAHVKMIFQKREIPPATMQACCSIIQDELENRFGVLLKPFNAQCKNLTLCYRRFI